MRTRIVRSVVQRRQRFESKDSNPGVLQTNGYDRQAALMHDDVGGGHRFSLWADARGPNRQCGAVCTEDLGERRLFCTQEVFRRWFNLVFNPPRLASRRLARCEAYPSSVGAWTPRFFLLFSPFCCRVRGEQGGRGVGRKAGQRSPDRQEQGRPKEEVGMDGAMTRGGEMEWWGGSGKA
ncbi:hypothetical protein P170DRAFT_144292 [Aspergillus steynii IBT 23096]|uniref:Uncharacterized protein n=1 Tax=Aspergillus steynii IBT 23096 TaxID=1392250 RepID=A0A2I2GC43_9EURO|nr:uncharacterized protein P170DRAFT_144292 [Aspergillus steynii IBT 23096]PLB50446.1 hypothetical protein P170DRAFT_144292 [Aspergillus steynii IBT 23096]